MIEKIILDQINNLLSAQKANFSVSQLERSSFGDYSTGFPLKLAKCGNYQTPEDIAKFFVSELDKNDMFSEVTFSPPGFINFIVNQKVAGKNLTSVIEEGDKYGTNLSHENQKARVEFVSANPTGPLHIGNARGGPLGSSLASILKANGYTVIQEYLHNNIGSQISNLGQSLLNLKSGEKLADQEYKGEYVEELVQKLPSDKGEPELAGRWAAEELLQEILSDLEQIGIKYDKVYHESEILSSRTKGILERLAEKGLLKEKEGAKWFAADDEFMKDREAVVIRSDSRPTYFANDIAYHDEKFSEGYDLIIDELGSGHDGHIPKLKAAMSALGHEVSKFKVIVHQNVRVKKGSDIVKMSKRAGDFVTARDVIDEVGSDAFRFLLLMNAPTTHMDFDLKLAKKQTKENPVYYVQYAHARTVSILAKTKLDFQDFDPKSFSTREEKELMLAVFELPKLVETIAETLAVHQLTHFAISLADIFHKFYETNQVLDQDEGVSKARLTLVKATQVTLKNTLSLLGVSAPDHM